MSIKATNWAYEQRLPNPDKAILNALAWCHHAKTGQCNPSVETISLMTGCSERTVQRSLKKLISGKFIAPIGSQKGGKNRSTKWRFIALKGCQTVTLNAASKGDNTTGFSKAPKGDCLTPNKEVYITGEIPAPKLRLVSGGNF